MTRGKQHSSMWPAQITTVSLSFSLSYTTSHACIHGALHPCIMTSTNLNSPWPKAQTATSTKKKKTGSDITPDPGGHWPQRPCAQGRTHVKQDQPQASAPGQNRTQCGGEATMHGLRTRQAGKSVPTQTRPGNGECTPQSTPQEGTLQQDPNTSASCAKGTYGPGQLQGRAGTGQHKPWQQQRSNSIGTGFTCRVLGKECSCGLLDKDVAHAQEGGMRRGVGQRTVSSSSGRRHRGLNWDSSHWSFGRFLRSAAVSASICCGFSSASSRGVSCTPSSSVVHADAGDAHQRVAHKPCTPAVSQCGRNMRSSMSAALTTAACHWHRPCATNFHPPSFKNIHKCVRHFSAPGTKSTVELGTAVFQFLPPQIRQHDTAGSPRQP